MVHHDTLATTRRLNKVPEVTVYFWVIKVLCTTVGESAADFLNVNLNLGLTGVSLLTGVLLLISLVVQFRADRYRAGRYWVTVAVVSVFGTLVTDNLTDNLNVPLETSTIVFAVLLAATFIVWYRAERTLSIHSIVTTRREAFYWLTILFTFALGTATGDLMAEVLGLGYLATGTIVAALILVLAIAWRVGLHPVLAFWAIYVLTRPLGASLGDYLSQPTDQGGLGLGTAVTSLIFCAAIIGTVIYLATSKADVTPAESHAVAPTTQRRGLLQTVVLTVVILAGGVLAYTLRTQALQEQSTVASAGSAGVAGQAAQPATRAPLGDLTVFRRITQQTLDLLNTGNQSAATGRVDELEIDWDNAEARLKPKDETVWTDIDGKIDTVLRELRATSPNPANEKAALTTLLQAV